MADVGIDKGKQIVSIAPIRSEVSKYKMLLVMMPFIFIVTFVYIIYLTVVNFTNGIPLEFYPVVLFVALIYIGLTMFSLTIYIRYAFPVVVFTNGIELKTTRLGAKMGRAGFIARSEMEEIEVYAVGKDDEKLGFSIQMKNGKTAWIGERDVEEMRSVIGLLKQNFGKLVREKGSLTKKKEKK